MANEDIESGSDEDVSSFEGDPADGEKRRKNIDD